jgi:outer membrane receptor for ferrienterochelin and colicins
MDRAAARDLKEVLEEQTGLAIVHDHGAGVQVQGLDPAYTLILIDGEPVIGRTAGTLELSRIAITDVERVEVVKGPSSSLYGADALAGVVNIITEEPRTGVDRLGINLHSRYASFRTLDLSARLAYSSGNVGASLALNRKSSAGYDLTPASISPTAPPTTDYTISPKIMVQVSPLTSVSVYGRIFAGRQESDLELGEGGSLTRMTELSKTRDWSIASKIEHTLDATTMLKGKVYVMSYTSDYTLRAPGSGAPHSTDPFDQTYVKVEAQVDAILTAQHLFTAGAGYVLESVTAVRIAEGAHRAKSAIAFAQHEWIPTDFLDVVASVRFDSHSDYAERLSPKASVLVSPLSWLKLRLSAGSGFKAPTFQQLYLDFTNPAVGYSVYGSTGVKDKLASLQASGQVQQLLVDPSSLSQIRPESSISFNCGVDVAPAEMILLRANVFRNSLKDMIETAPVAVKTNGQSVFTYFNLNRVFTQGLETELTVTPGAGFTVHFGYQYVQAVDRDVLEAVRAGRIAKRGSTGRLRAVQESEYGGLFNRSAHSGTFKVNYDNPALGFSASCRCIVRGRYGFSDMNGNTILDDESEYAPGYALWNLSLSQRLPGNVTLQCGIENMLDKTQPQFDPSLAGRRLFCAVSVEY